MYRYTAQKNKQANQKFKQKQLNKKILHTSSKKNAKKKEVLPEKNATKAVKAESKFVVPSWLMTIFRTTLSLLGICFLLYVIVVIGVNSFLPQIFSLKEEKNLLLIASENSNQASRLYLVKIVPQTTTTSVLSLDGKALVPVTGGYGQYPLGSLSPFLKLEESNLGQIVAAYNFALKQAIDEVYFIPELAEIKDQKTLQRAIGARLKEQFLQTTKMDTNLIEIYFGIRSSQYFSQRDFPLISEASGVDVAFLAKEKLSACPVVLINAAGVNGLAKKTSQMVEMNGFAVINWETSSNIEAQSKIYYDENEPDCQKVVEAVRKMFPNVKTIIPDGGAQAKKSRAKAVISLGKELSD